VMLHRLALMTQPNSKLERLFVAANPHYGL
jgi:hypothetical protein